MSNLQNLFLKLKGGKGSGNWGHASMPGKYGGSISRSSGMSVRTGRDAAERQQVAKGKTPAMDAQAVKKFEDKFDAEQDVKDFSRNLSDLKSRVKKFQKPRHLTQAAWDSERERLRNLIPENESRLREAKARASALKDVKAPGFGEFEKQSKEGRMSGQTWKHPQYGEVSFSYSGKLYTQNVAASGRVAWTSPTRKRYEKSWNGATALDSAKKYLSDTFGITS